MQAARVRIRGRMCRSFEDDSLAHDVLTSSIAVLACTEEEEYFLHLAKR